MAGKVITVAQQKGGAGKTTIAANLAVGMTRAGHRVALLDTDPQGSLGRWFMTRRADGLDDMEFSTASAWGVGYECEKLKKSCDFVILDTPPKVDADLRPALKISDLVLVPVASSQVDVWAVESVLDLVSREKRDALVVLNRFKAGTRVGHDVTAAVRGMDVPLAETTLGNRVVYAETLGLGRGVQEHAKSAATDEMERLVAEILGRIS
ncbi:ParA family partition ATPase [Oceaniglobus ichthyenteri]|uniref:ParA family partition ATPase n=1 Tax=Oceaniglobus ichthyenteri TaxID=2136177 RepID=UPI000D3A4B06|nr:ParA family partition ATPase [Oceaniglobus ichthyenteri]